MLYLAEAKKTRVGFGGSRTEFRLLACQRSEYNWSPIPGDEKVQAPDEANSAYGEGALVLVELTTNRQIQSHEWAGKRLVGILQSFSRQQEKAKTQEEEIEQWKQSLTYQSQELNRREMEMEARQEQLQQMEEDFERLEQQQQEVETARSEIERLREEFERKNQDLEGAWAQLNGELRRFEERQAELQQSAVLDAQQGQHLQDLLNRLSSIVAPTDVVREHLGLSFETVTRQQGEFDRHWQLLDQYRGSAHQLQGEVEQQTQALHHRWQDWHNIQAELEQQRAEFKVQESSLSVLQEYAQALAQRLKIQEALHHQLLDLTESTDRFKLDAKIDVPALERMPLEELQVMVKDLGSDLEKVSRFVNSQEEELTLQQNTIEELQQQIHQASEYDRLSLETELADERESYQMLNETLIGQRRNLQERQEVLRRHQAILARRQGLPFDDSHDRAVDITPVLDQVNQVRHQQVEELRKLEERIHALSGSLEQTRSAVEQRSHEQAAKLNDLKNAEQHLKTQQSTLAELWGKVTVYQESMQPAQDCVTELKGKLEAIAEVMARFQESSDYQLQSITEMRQVIMGLIGTSPEFVAS